MASALFKLVSSAVVIVGAGLLVRWTWNKMDTQEAEAGVAQADARQNAQAGGDAHQVGLANVDVGDRGVVDEARAVHHVVAEDVPDDAVLDAGAEYDNDDRPRRALEAHQQEAAEAKVNAWKQKGKVGAKKAKSLARREQRRAYFEFVRQEAEDERLRAKREEEAFGDLYAEERELREVMNELARVSLEEESRQRREAEQRKREERRLRRAAIESALESGKCRLESLLDREIALEVPDVLVLENGEFALKITEEALDAVAEKLNAAGELSFADMSRILEQVRVAHA